MIATPKDKQCLLCQHVKSLTPKHFRRVGGPNGDWKPVCKSCEEKARRKKRMDRVERKAVEHMLNAAAIGGSNIPHTAELLESIMHYFGGASGFASLVLKQYFESDPGSRTRNAVLEMVMRLAAKNTEQGGARKPIQLYSEEELEEEIDKRIRQVATLVKTGGRVINAATAEHQEPLQLPVGRTEATSGGVEVEAARSLEAIQANRAADGVPQVPVERDPGDRRESVG